MASVPRMVIARVAKFMGPGHEGSFKNSSIHFR